LTLNGFPARYSRPHFYLTLDKNVELPRLTFLVFTALPYVKGVLIKLNECIYWEWYKTSV